MNPKLYTKDSDLYIQWAWGCLEEYNASDAIDNIWKCRNHSDKAAVLEAYAFVMQGQYDTALLKMKHTKIEGFLRPDALEVIALGREGESSKRNPLRGLEHYEAAVRERLQGARIMHASLSDQDPYKIAELHFNYNQHKLAIPYARIALKQGNANAAYLLANSHFVLGHDALAVRYAQQFQLDHQQKDIFWAIAARVEATIYLNQNWVMAGIAKGKQSLKLLPDAALLELMCDKAGIDFCHNQVITAPHLKYTRNTYLEDDFTLDDDTVPPAPELMLPPAPDLDDFLPPSCRGRF